MDFLASVFCQRVVPPFLQSSDGSRLVQTWVKPKLGGVVGRGDPLSWSPPSTLCSAAPNPSLCASCLYGLPPTSGLGKAAFPCASIDLLAPGSGCCSGKLAAMTYSG